MRFQFGSGRQQIPYLASNVAVASGGGVTIAKTLYVSLQGENPVGLNLPTIVGPFAVGVGQRLQVTLPAGLIADGEAWTALVIGASIDTDPATFVQLAKVSQFDAAGNPLVLPKTVTFTSDDDLALSAIAADPTALPSTPLHGMLRSISSLGGQIFEFVEGSALSANGTTVLAVPGGRWIARPGNFSTYVPTTDSPGGCDRPIESLVEALVQTPRYACNGSNGEERTFWIANTDTEAITSGERVGINVLNGENPVSAAFEYLLQRTFLGYASLVSGALRTTDGEGDPFPGVDEEIAFENKKTDLLFPDDLQPGEAFSFKVRPRFKPQHLNNRISDKSLIKISPYLFFQAGNYSEAGEVLGNWIYAREDLRRVVPVAGLTAKALKGSGMINNRSFRMVGPTSITGLSSNTANQLIVVTGDGTVYRTTDALRGNEALLAIVSTESGVSKASDWSANLNVSGSQGLRITCTYPSDGTKATIRASYPDASIAGLTGKAQLNATSVVVYVKAGSSIRKFSQSFIDGATQAIDLADWNAGEAIASVPNAPSEDFSLFAPTSAAAIANGSGNFPAGTIQVAYAFGYNGFAVSRISHDESQGAVTASNVTIAELARTGRYWAEPVWDLMALRAVPSTKRYAGQNRIVIALRKPYIWNPGSLIADDGTATSVAVRPDDVPLDQPGRYLIDDSSNFFHSSQFSASGGIPASAFGESRDYCIDDVEASPTFGTLFYKSGDEWTALCVLRGPTGPKGTSFLVFNRDPLSGEGENGDAALNTTSRDLFIKAAGAWSLYTNVKDVNPRGLWNSIATYKLNDLAGYGGQQWRSLTTNTNVIPSEGANWTLFLDKGSIGPAGATGATGATGAPGATGPAGAAATFSIGTITTLPAGSSASVDNSGSSSAAILDFGIPQGAQGPAGDVTASVGSIKLDNNATPPATTATQTAIYSDASGVLQFIPVNSGVAKLFAFLNLDQAWSGIQSFVATRFKQTTAPSTAADELALFATPTGFKYREQSNGAERSLATLNLAQAFTEIQTFLASRLRFTTAPSTAADELGLFADASGLNYREASNGATQAIATLNRDQAYTKRQRSVPVTLTSSGGSVTIDTSLSGIFILNLTENTTINVSNLQPGTQFELHMINGATAYTVTFGSVFDFGATAPTAIGANKSDILTATSRGGTTLRAAIAKGFGA